MRRREVPEILERSAAGERRSSRRYRAIGVRGKDHETSDDASPGDDVNARSLELKCSREENSLDIH